MASSCSTYRELPEQDWEEICCSVLSKQNTQGHVPDDALFIDDTFPPDITSLTYVYTGDDRYEQTVFKRPHDLCVSPVLYGIGGVCDVHLSWRNQRDREWFLYALAVLSLSPKCLEALIPGYRTFEQSFQNNYTGAFQFHLWRFGEWVEVIVDDSLPVHNNRLSYSPYMGNPPEYWGPLVEKAYAKCHQTYEAIESGNTLNALTDLTGAICERITLDEVASSDVFDVLYKSHVNRSLITCWRHPRSRRDVTFKLPRRHRMNTNSCSFLAQGNAWPAEMREMGLSYMFLVTAVVKFPFRDGLHSGMIRLKDPYCEGQPLWTGEFSPSDVNSWNRVNPRFLSSFRPKECCDPYEFWMTFTDFCLHFGEAIVCSSPEPQEGPRMDMIRSYKPQMKASFTNIELVDKNIFKARRLSEQPQRPNDLQRRTSIGMSLVDELTPIEPFEDKPASAEKYISKNEEVNHNKVTQRCAQFRKARSDVNRRMQMPQAGPDAIRESCSKELHNDTNNSNSTSTPKHRSLRLTQNSDSLGSIASTSTSESISDVTIRLANDQTQPAEQDRNSNQFNLLNKRLSIFESRMDYFRPHGMWKQIIYRFGRWKNFPCVNNFDLHSRNARIPLVLTKRTHCREVNPNNGHQTEPHTCHVIVSLMQDYRRRSKSATGIMVTMGYRLLQTSKHQDRDTKRPGVTQIDDVISDGDSREITRRYDLEPGSYFLLPYTQYPNQEGEFLLRVIGEQDEQTEKGVCILS